MSEKTEATESTDASEVVFWGFPARVQEQVDSVVASATFPRRHVTGDELHMPSCKLAFYWWPEREDTAKMQLQLLRRANQSSQLPIIVVATSQTRKCASEAIGLEADGILIWPFSFEQFAEAARPFCSSCAESRTQSLNARLLSDIAGSFVSVINRTLDVTCRRGQVKLVDENYSFRNAVLLARVSTSASGLAGISMTSEMANALSVKMSGQNWLSNDSVSDETGLKRFSAEVGKELSATATESAVSVSLDTAQVFSTGPKFGLDTRGEPFIAVEYFANETPFEVLVCLRQKQSA